MVQVARVVATFVENTCSCSVSVAMDALQVFGAVTYYHRMIEW